MRQRWLLGLAAMMCLAASAQEVKRRRDVDFKALEVTQRSVETVKGEAPSLLPPGNWKLVWNDEFNGTALDASKWLYRTNFYGRRMKGYSDKGAELDGRGHLRLKLVFDNGGEICASQLQTGSNYHDAPRNLEPNPWGQAPIWGVGEQPKPTFMHRYGYWEIRCRFQKLPGWWSAFWLQSPSIGMAPNARYAGVEVDVMENFHRDGRVTSGSIYGGYGKAYSNGGDRVDYRVDPSAWHRFGLLWTPTNYVYYCDGRETARTSDMVSQVEEFLIVSCEVKGWREGKMDTCGAEIRQAALKADGTLRDDAFEVDYVRVYDECPQPRPTTHDVDLSAAKVYVSTNATVPEIEAAKLFLRAQRMVAGLADTTNVAPHVSAEWPADGVVIGWQESALLKTRAKALGLKPWREMRNLGDMIVQTQRDGAYVLAGNSPEGAYYAVADVLYRNGARFIHTGTPADNFESGTYLEWMKAIRAPRARTYVPTVARRTGFALNGWPKADLGKGKDRAARLAALQLGANQFAVRNGTTPAGPLCGGHARNAIGCESIQPPVSEFKRHPEWFPLVDGKRWRPAPGGWVTEGCWSSPGFADWVVDWVVSQYRAYGGANMITDLNLTNSDGGPKCQCDACKKYRAQFPDESSWYWDYHAKLAKRIEARVPGLYRYTFAYIHSLCFPKAGKQVVSHLDAIQYCPYQRCYVHPYSDRTCRTNRLDMDRAEDWRNAEMPIGDFDYCYDVFQPAMNMPNWNLTWDVVRYWKELNGERGVPSIYMESATSPNGCGGKSRVSAYVVARALWDCAETPAETHLEDFCRVGFGDAAPEMLAWYRACAAAWQGQKAHLTATFNNPTGTAKSYFNERLMRQGEQAFASAERKIKARLAPAGTPSERLTREQNLAAKQYATWQWEKKHAFDEWKQLREKALATSLEINCEMGDASDTEFDRMSEYKLRPHWGGDVDNNATARFYRTKDALRIRVKTVNPNLKPVPPTTAGAGDDERAYMDDHVELFLQAPGKTDYLHLCLGADGSRYDALCKDAKAFTSDAWKTAVKTADGSAEYTLTIPWTVFGADHTAVPGTSYKLLLDLSGPFPNAKKPGEFRWFCSGLPRVGFHDVAVGADLLIDDNAGRRAGGL